jgi:hypothetical protein
MKKYIYLLKLFGLFFCGNVFGQADAEPSHMVSNFNVWIEPMELTLSYYYSGYLLINGIVKEVQGADKQVDEAVDGDTIQIILEDWRLADRLKLGSDLKLNICNYNWPHWIIGPEGWKTISTSHFGNKQRCFLSQYNGCEGRESVRICPQEGIKLYLCADVLE